jgi:formylglycine-generating enzyme required for sulfatase activity
MPFLPSEKKEASAPHSKLRAGLFSEEIATGLVILSVDGKLSKSPLPSRRLLCAEGRGKNQVKGIDTGNFPVERVSWGEAVEFCKKLSGLPAERRAGSVHRLPTEAEWEYACRGGASSSTPFHFGNSLSFTQANFDGNHPSGGAVAGPP